MDSYRNIWGYTGRCIQGQEIDQKRNVQNGEKNIAVVYVETGVPLTGFGLEVP